MDFGEVVRVRRIDQRAYPRHGVARADSLTREPTRTGSVIDPGHVVILVDDLKRHEAIAGIGHGDRDRPSVEVKNRERINWIAIKRSKRLMVIGEGSAGVSA